MLTLCPNTSQPNEGYCEVEAVLKVNELAQKEYDPVLLLSPNKSGPFSVCGQALVPASCSADGWALGCLMDRLHSARTGPMASWIDWPKGAVGESTSCVC